jgi:flagellar motor switch/type III secretory pathway protein FliN
VHDNTALPLINSALLRQVHVAEHGLSKRFYGQKSLYKNSAIHWVKIDLNQLHTPIVFSCRTEDGKVLFLYLSTSRHPDDLDNQIDKVSDSQLFATLLRHAQIIDLIENILHIRIHSINKVLNQKTISNLNPYLGFEISISDRLTGRGALVTPSFNELEELTERVVLKRTTTNFYKKVTIPAKLFIDFPKKSSVGNTNLKTNEWLVLHQDISKNINAYLCDAQRVVFFNASINFHQKKISLAEQRYKAVVQDRYSSGVKPMQEKLKNSDIVEKYVNGKTELAQYPLDLQFEIGRLNFSIEELLNLAPGQTITLNRALDQQTVHIYTNNTLVAKGELALLDNSLCVRLSSIEQQP